MVRSALTVQGALPASSSQTIWPRLVSTRARTISPGKVGLAGGVGTGRAAGSPFGTYEQRPDASASCVSPPFLPAGRNSTAATMPAMTSTERPTTPGTSQVGDFWPGREPVGGGGDPWDVMAWHGTHGHELAHE